MTLGRDDLLRKPPKGSEIPEAVGRTWDRGGYISLTRKGDHIRIKIQDDDRIYIASGDGVAKVLKGNLNWTEIITLAQW